MGEVYRARDSRLSRIVAIKILPDSFAADTERIARFEREAKTLAALNHPNVAQIYGLEQWQGRRVLAMELVEGENLAERLRGGPLPSDEALAIARQVADGLDAAHELGIVHRDLKPSNIQLRQDGTAKILDFGLAKALTPSASPADVVSSPTMTSPAMTTHGVILGTAAYMAPEQAKGRVVDRRADIWAFGAVLYEMVTGRRAFEGDDVSELFAAVLKAEPDWSRVPRSLQRLLKSCLEKDPRRRLRDIGDWSQLVDHTPVPPAVRDARGARTAWVVVATSLVVAGISALIHYRERAPAIEPVRFQVAAPPGNAFENLVSLAPDGRRLVFNARDASGVIRLWIRDFDALESRVVPGTDGARTAFWSPDGRSLGVVVINQLKRIEVFGDRAVTLYEAPNPALLGSGTWSTSGVILFGGTTGGALRQIAATGGVVTPVTRVESDRQELAHGLPQFLPDGRRFLYYRVSRNAKLNGVYLGSIDGKPEEQSLDRVLDSDQIARYIPSGPSAGHLVFLQKGTLMIQPFDPGPGRLTGQPTSVVDHVANRGAQGFFSASASVLAYRTGRPAGGGRLSQLTWLDRQGKPVGTVGEPNTFTALTLSPDATRAIIADGTIAERDLWILEMDRGIAGRFVSNPAIEQAPVWSPDMKQVAFASNRNGRYELFVRDVGGSSDELILGGGRSKFPTSWSKDGRFLLYSERNVDAEPQSDMWLLPISGDRTPIPILRSAFDEAEARFSPDMRWIAYTSNESGRFEIYLRPFDAATPSTVGGGHLRLSKDGGVVPRWRHDSRELAFLGPSGTIMAVSIAPAPSLPVALFTVPVPSNWDFSGDGQRFLVEIPEASSEAAPINVLLNWQSR